MGALGRRAPAISAVTSAVNAQTTAVQQLAAHWAQVATSAGAATSATRRAALPPPLPGNQPPRLTGSSGGRHGPRQGWHLGRFGASVPVAGGHVHASAPSSVEGVAAGGALWAMYELGKAGVAPMHEEAKLSLLGSPDSGKGLSEGDRMRMMREARQIAVDVAGSGYTKNLKTRGELYSNRRRRRRAVDCAKTR